MNDGLSKLEQATTRVCYRCQGTGRIPIKSLERILATVTHEWQTSGVIADLVQREPFHVRSGLRALLKHGLIERRGAGARGSSYEWRLVSDGL
jgi:predicted transcriptional regulator